MQLDDISVFLQIASTGSLSAAARASYRPKATISHQLRRLEEDIGAPLFTRSASRLVLSQAGLRFPRARAQYPPRLRTRPRWRAAQPGGRQRNAARRHDGRFASNLVAPLILHFARHYPELRLDVMVIRSDLLLSSRDSLDCLLYLGEPPMPQVAEMTGRLLGRFSFALYCSPGYLQRHGMPKTPNELRSHDLLGYHNGETTTLWELRSALGEFSLHPNTKLLSNDYWVVKLAAIHDHGICFIPTFFAGLEVKQGMLVPVLPEWSSRDVPMYALYASHRLANSHLKTLINSLSENFTDMFSYLYKGTRN